MNFGPSLEPTTVSVILAMAAVTYATKAGGLWFVGRLERSDRISSSAASRSGGDDVGRELRWRAALEILPGVIVVSIVAGELVEAGPREWAGAAVVAVVARKTGALSLSLVAGVGTVIALRGIG